MRGDLHHIDLTVSDVGASFVLYDGVLRALGYHNERKNENRADWILVTPLGEHSVGIVRANAGSVNRHHDRYSPGLHHLAWSVDARSDVDKMHDVVKQLGAQVLDPPADYPQYNRGRGYYAFFFADRDGLKLECVYTPRKQA
jgi:glyoxylase I family protein